MTTINVHSPRRHRRRVGRRRPAGFSLLEVMVVVAIIGILASLAIGYSGTWRRVQNHRELAREAFNALSLARAYSLQHGVTTKVQFDDVRQHIYAFIEPVSGDCTYATELSVYAYPGNNIRDWFGQGDLYDANTTFALADPASCGGYHTMIFDHRGISRAQDGTPRGSVLTINDARTGKAISIDISVAGALRIRM